MRVAQPAPHSDPPGAAAAVAPAMRIAEMLTGIIVVPAALASLGT